MKGLVATQNGLLALGAQQSDLRPRFINYAADFFAKLAQGERPSKPDPFMAEITATVIAEAVGAEVPMPMQVEKRTYAKGKGRKGAEEDPDATPESIEVLPGAEAWMKSHGIGKINPKTLAVVSVFMRDSDRTWKAKALAKAVGGTATAMAQIFYKLRDRGILTSEGERTKCVWKLAEMPPHV